MRLARELDPVEIRVLGSLLEKQQATPDAYPLSLNSLVLACNQKSNREPVTELSESDVTEALLRLHELVLVWKVGGARTEKWEHNLDARWELGAPGKAVLTLLFLRGAQTPGELRGRSDRLYPFATLDEVEATLQRLSHEAEPLVFELPRRPGQKEGRWSHLVGGVPPGTDRPEPIQSSVPALPRAAVAASGEPLSHRVDRLEAAVASLADELKRLKERLGED